MKQIQLLLVFILLLLFILTSCTYDKPDITKTTTSPAEAILFSRYMAIGDNITAGYQSAALTKIHQDYSFPNLIAKQANTSDFMQPLLGYPGLGSESLAGFGILELKYLDNPFTPNTITPDPVINAVPFTDYPDFRPLTNPYFSDEIRNYPLPYNNLGIPGILVNDVLYGITAANSSSQSLLIDVVLRNPVAGNLSVFEQAKAFVPSLITCWVGGFDIAPFALTGGANPNVPAPTPEIDFHNSYSEMIDSLINIVPQLGPNQPSLVAANIPDITITPFFNSLPPFVIDTTINALKLDASNNPIPLVGVNPATDLILNSAKLAFRIGQGIPQGVLNGTGDPLDDRFFLDADEIDMIKNAVTEYNESILRICAFRGVPVVDMYGFYNEISETGYEVAGITFTDKQITGSFYSLDGVHPTDLGNALLANQWIQKLNQTLNISVPQVDIVKLSKELEPNSN